ncbi:hypothetical protein CEXT_469111 [Caerostris extrusa]|uniref:Uncharacterized protein n=1 Tax=Caerostris extrusa TaxID=172846 RepID=A0AAV4XP12_CAEEX|nr:hypothetical protein CEXT_469111 [Caerostris extrusa]
MYHSLLQETLSCQSHDGSCTSKNAPRITVLKYSALGITPVALEAKMRVVKYAFSVFLLLDHLLALYLFILNGLPEFYSTLVAYVTK